MFRMILPALCMLTLVLPGSPLLLSPALGADGQRSAAEVRRQHEQMVARGINYLLTKGQAEDGSFSAFSGPAVTALVTTAILKHGHSPDEPRLSRSLKYLEQYVQPSGGIHHPESVYRNYETSVIVVCFSEANRDGRYDEVLGKADAFLKGLQWDEGEGKTPADFEYGGAGYGKHNRPDLSNTAFLIEALRATGNDADSEAIQRALVFVSRCQNLESEHNTTPFSTKVQDGGMYYTPAAGGVSQAGTTAAGGLRSYGSMTYTGLKSMIYAGVGPDDPRVQAAVRWVQNNYTVEANPGLGDNGLYYYYHTFAKALDAIGMDVVTDEMGAEHHWRVELTAELARRQQPDGSWLNENARWLEGDNNLVTAYVLLTLAHSKPQPQKPQEGPGEKSVGHEE